MPGIANETRPPGSGDVTAACHGSLLSSAEVGSLRQPHAGGCARIFEPADVVDPGPVAFTTVLAGRSRSELPRDDVDDVGTANGAPRNPEAFDARVVEPDGAEELGRP